MASSIHEVVCSSLAGHAPSSNESAITQRLASELATSGKKAIWVAKKHHASLPVTVKKRETSFPGSMKSYDLACADSQTATTPDMLIQVKWRHSGSEVQGLHLFLGDIALAAVDAELLKTGSTKAATAYAVSVMPKAVYESSAYWKPYIAKLAGGPVKLVLEPSVAAGSKLNATIKADKWIDITAHTITPQTKPQFNRIFSAGTNGKYLGLFNRPGRLVIELSIEPFAGSEKAGFVVGIGSPKLDKAKGLPLKKWWP